MLSFARLDAVLLLEEPADIVIVLFTRLQLSYVALKFSPLLPSLISNNAWSCPPRFVFLIGNFCPLLHWIVYNPSTSPRLLYEPDGTTDNLLYELVSTSTPPATFTIYCVCPLLPAAGISSTSTFTRSERSSIILSLWSLKSLALPPYTSRVLICFVSDAICSAYAFTWSTVVEICILSSSCICWKFFTISLAYLANVSAYPVISVRFVISETVVVRLVSLLKKLVKEFERPALSLSFEYIWSSRLFI